MAFLKFNYRPAFFDFKKRPVLFKAMPSVVVGIVLLFSAGVKPCFAQTTSGSVVPATPFMGAVQTSKALNIRAGQSTNFEPVGQLRPSDLVVVVDQSYGWYKIKLPIYAEAFVKGDYVKKLGDGIGETNANRLNIRARPNQNAALLGQLQRGELLRIIEEMPDGWLKIEPTESSYGWVSAEYVQSSSVPVPPPRTIQPPIRNIYTKKRMEEQQAAQLVAAQPIEMVETVKSRPFFQGVVAELGEQAFADDVRHRLITEDKTVYYLKGYRRIFDIFLQNKVKVEGTPAPESNSTRQVIFVSKILFVL